MAPPFGGALDVVFVASALISLVGAGASWLRGKRYVNPYSEAQFKTLKYRPEFPARFGSLEDARAFCRSFFTWYNEVHRHAGIGLLTPAAVHFGRAPEVQAARAEVLAGAYAAHPERFVRRPPTPPELPSAVWINPPPEKEVPTQ
jgi:putative transposase